MRGNMLGNSKKILLCYGHSLKCQNKPSSQEIKGDKFFSKTNMLWAFIQVMRFVRRTERKSLSVLFQ